MTGCFTDNQPDFTWIAPMEEKRFTQYFMPYQKIGTVHNATKDLVMNFENGKVNLYATGNIGEVTVKTFAGKEVLSGNVAILLPTMSAEFKIDEFEKVTDIKIYKNGREYLAYTVNGKKQEIPEAAKAAPEPQDCETNEDLYLYGLHLEQYRHATRAPEDYYLEGLRRDPTDVRLNNVYGRHLLKRGLFAESETYFRTAIKKITRSNPNPYDSEPYYNLGLSLLYQNKLSESYDAFYKSAWSNSCQEAAFYHMACICARNGDYALALEHVEDAIIKNGRNYKALNLKALLLRVLGRRGEAKLLADYVQKLDPLDVISSRILGAKPRIQTNAAIEIAVEYAAAGFYMEAYDILNEDKSGYPLVAYHMSYILDIMRNACGDDKKRRELYCTHKEFEKLSDAQAADSYLCFPHRLEDMLVLEEAVKKNPDDGMAPYYLGCLYYDKKRYDEAISNWEKSTELCPEFPTSYRNLALAYLNKQNDIEKAQTALETAFKLDESDSRVLMELDQLYKKAGRTPEERLSFLADYPQQVSERDDLYTEYVTLLNMNGAPEKALELLDSHSFHPWEGGEGKAPAQFVAAHCTIAKAQIEAGKTDEAIENINKTFTYPLNLGEGKLYGAQENLQYYLLGCAYEKAGNALEAKKAFETASSGLSEPQSAMYYNDQPPETIFCQGLAHLKLGNKEEADVRFNKLISYCDEHENDEVKIDYFAVSLPDFLVFDEDLNKKNKVHCLFMKALGFLGLGERDKAEERFNEARSLEKNHFGMNYYYSLFC